MYYLLPFHFERIGNHEIIVNEVGDFLIIPNGSVETIINRQIVKDGELYKNLTASFFISETPIPELIDVLATRLRTKKQFLNDFTTLHIFVLTLRCNQNCIYCQASSKKYDEGGGDISISDLLNGIDLMFHSPANNITMEFQGGEPSLVPDLLKFAIEHTIKLNQKYNKIISYVLCTNCINLTKEILDICKKYNVLISTSLDGPEFIHNFNRGKIDSFQNVLSGINKAKLILGKDRVSALMTTSEYSLNYPNDIINTYLDNGFHSIFLRPLNPYGLATNNDNWYSYFKRFIQFYKIALDYIIEINQHNTFFVEELTAIILRKILTPFSTGFVDLQSPAGIITSVIVYNYDGYVYASDESRMLAEFNEYEFRLGKLTDRYEDIFYGAKAQKLSQISSTEIIAGCSDCAFQAYCGGDPVRNFSTQGDSYGFRPTSLFCLLHKSIITHIFYLIINKHDIVMPIFTNWIKQNEN